MFQRILPYLLAAAHLGLWGVAGLTLKNLTIYPDHFDITGKPDSWSDQPWWVVPLVALFMTGLLVGALALARKLAKTAPQWVNVPRKKDWVALPVEARLRSLKPVEGLLLGLAVFMNLMFVSIVLDTYGVATGRQASMSVVKLFVVLGVMLVWLVLSVMRIRQAIGDEVRLQRQASNPAGGAP